MQPTKYHFTRAVPVWKSGDERVMNQSLVLEYISQSKNLKLKIAGQSAYTVLVNGELCAYGPARCAHGYHKVDETDLTNYLVDGENIITVRAFGYSVNSYEFANSESFVCAEILCGDKIVAYTDPEPLGFRACLYSEKVVKAPRYSGQRTFCECYELSPDTVKEEISLSEVQEKYFTLRDVPYGEYERIYPTSVIARGDVYYDESAEYYNPQNIANAVAENKGYDPKVLSAVPHIEASRIKCKNKVELSEAADKIVLKKESYADVEFPINQTGIPAFSIESDGDGELLMLFDECLTDGEVDCFRFKIVGAITFKLAVGKYSFVAAEPYVMKYARFIARGANITVSSPRLIEIAFPKSEITVDFASGDADMKKVYDAALESFRANATDIYMDCPSRERAGWLFDSYFTSRVEYALTGKSAVERAFLANFLYHELESLPTGMLPMCYPGDHPSGRFIPNWAMWYLLELYEYRERSGDVEFIAEAKPRMYALLKYFRDFENEYGLLESLKSWVFVEWSRANDLVQDVSFASNMLYAMFKERLGSLYGDTALIKEADALRATIREMSMTPSGFFSDNAKRIGGKLVTTGERTEACQYYAFYTGVATEKTHPELWRILTEEFGPDRKERGLYPEIYHANVLPGNYLRLELLERAGMYEKLYSEIKGYFVYMSNVTGTLWEHDSNLASMNHGFTSHVICWMEKLGLLTKRK